MRRHVRLNPYRYSRLKMSEGLDPIDPIDPSKLVSIRNDRDLIPIYSGEQPRPDLIRDSTYPTDFHAPPNSRSSTIRCVTFPTLTFCYA